MSSSASANIFNVLALLGVCATGAMHVAGIELSLYWIYPEWWDVPTHMLGGLTVGLWAAAVSARMNLPPRRAAMLIIGLVLLFGLAWEVFEMVESVAGGWGGYWFDTSKDFCADIVGGMLAWGTYRMFRKP